MIKIFFLKFYRELLIIKIEIITNNIFCVLKILDKNKYGKYFLIYLHKVIPYLTKYIDLLNNIR